MEIGCDGDSTQGSEQSHMHTEDDASPTAFKRGYETWFMLEAKRRNPSIHLSALEWGVPGWVLNNDTTTSGPRRHPNNFWSKTNTDYIIAWLVGMQGRGLQMDSIGLCRNEAGCNSSFIKSTRTAMNLAGFTDVQIIAGRSHVSLHHHRICIFYLC